MGFEACEDPFGGAVFQRGFVHDLHGLETAGPRVWVWTEDHGVPRFDRHDAFKEDGRRGVRYRSEREDDPDGFGDFDQATLRELTDRADRAFIFDVVVHKLGGDHVLESFVFKNSESGFLDGQPRKMLCLLQASDDHRLDDPVDVFLGVLGENRGCAPGLADEPFEVSYAFFAETFYGRERLHPPLGCLTCNHCRPLRKGRGTCAQKTFTLGCSALKIVEK